MVVVCICLTEYWLCYAGEVWWCFRGRVRSLARYAGIDVQQRIKDAARLKGTKTGDKGKANVELQ